MSEKTTDQPSGHDQSKASGLDGDKKDVVSYETFQELLGQRKKDQEKAKQLESKLKEIEERDKLAQESKLKEEGNYKALLEAREKEKQELADKLSEFEKQVKTYEETFSNTKKLNAFNKALGGKLKSDDYYRFVDLTKIAIDPSTGEVDEASTKNYIKEFVPKYGKDLVDFGGKSLPDAAPARASVSTENLKTFNDYKAAMAQAFNKK